MSVRPRPGLTTASRERGWEEAVPTSGLRAAVVVVLLFLLSPTASPAQTAELFLQSNVPTATVSVDGRTVGTTDADGNVLVEGLAAGRRTIRLRKPGYWTASTRTALEPELTNVVSLELTPRDGGTTDLLVETNVPEAQVVLDDTQRAETGANGQVALSSVDPGRHRLVVQKEGYASAARTVSVSGSVADQTVQLRLEREGAGRADSSGPTSADTGRDDPAPVPDSIAPDSTGPDSAGIPEVPASPSPTRLVVSANVGGVQVYVNGTYRGTTPRTGTLEVEADTGQYRVLLRKDGFEPRRKTGRLAAGATRTLSFTLRREEPAAGFGQSRSLLLILIGVVGLGVLVVAVVVGWRRRRSAASGEDSIDRYRMVEPIGRESITTLYLAEDRVEDRYVVLKLLDEAYEGDRSIVEAFLKQGEALRHIAASEPDAPVVKAFRYGREKEWGRKRAFIELEYVRGTRLSAHLEAHDLDVREALTVLRQVCTGLQAAHDRQLWHGNLTPDTVIVTDTDPEIRVKLVNFQVRPRDRARQKRNQSPPGAPVYVSPEERREEAIDGKADVYAAGVLFCTIMTGSPPDADRELHEGTDGHGAAPQPDLPEVPAHVESLIHRMLKSDPDDRPAASKIADMIDLVRETT